MVIGRASLEPPARPESGRGHPLPMNSSRGTATRNNLTIVARRNRPGGSILSAKLTQFLAAINRHDPAKFPPGSENAVHQTLDSQKVVDIPIKDGRSIDRWSCSRNSEYGRPFLSFCPHEVPNVGAPLDSFPLSFETVASLPGPIRRSLGRNTENRLGTRSMPPSWPPTRRKA
jgi:hypothetical protein